MKYWRLLAHNHWFTFNIFNRKIKICARCSGYVTGFFLMASINKYFSYFFDPLKIGFQFLICILLFIPLIYDWLLQSWSIKQSNNKKRYLTGVFTGIGIRLLYGISSDYNKNKYLIIIFAFFVFLIGFVGKYKKRASAF